MNPLAKVFNDLITRGFEFFGRYYSSYRGFVISNDDPDGFGRLQLKVSNVYGDNTMKYWAWQKGCFSGKNYGLQVLPKVGDMVFVEFEYGDPRRPIWTHGHFSGDINGVKEKPNELKDPNLYWFKSPLGHLVIIDDTNNKIRVEHKDGNSLSIDEQYIILNGGLNGGLTITPELKTQLDKTNSLISALTGVINGPPIPEPGNTAPSALQIALQSAIILEVLGDYSNIENTDIKH